MPLEYRPLLMILSDSKVISVIVTNNKGTYDAVSHVIFLHIRRDKTVVVNRRIGSQYNLVQLADGGSGSAYPAGCVSVSVCDAGVL